MFKKENGIFKSCKQHEYSMLTITEWIIGLGFASVSVVLSILTAVLVKCFEANHDLPTNLVIIRGVLQIILFAVAVAQGDQFILPASRKEKLLVITRGFLTGVLFFSNIAAIRFLPLGDVFTLLAARSIVCISFSALVLCIYNKTSGNPLDINKTCVVLVAAFGFYLFLGNKYNSSGDFDGDYETGPDSVEDIALPVPQFAFFLELPLGTNTVLLGMTMALLNLVLNVPIKYLTNKCEGTTASVQSFWSGVGGFLVGVVTSFLDIKDRTNIFLGFYSAYEFTVMLFISISFIVITVLQTQATKFISTPMVNLVSLVQIPVAYLLCPNAVMPDFYSVMGMLFILSSSIVGDWVLYLEEKYQEGYQEITGNRYEEL